MLLEVLQFLLGYVFPIYIEGQTEHNFDHILFILLDNTKNKNRTNVLIPAGQNWIWNVDS